MVLLATYERLNDYPEMFLLLILGLIGIGGSFPPIIERVRRRKLENALPEILESMSSNIGAGEGLEQAMSRVADLRNDRLGSMFKRALQTSRASSFDAAMAELALNSRSKQIQRVVNLIITASEQGASLKEILFNMSQEYTRLNQLMNKRENELMGRALMITIFISILLPGIIAFMIGAFASPSSGMDVSAINRSLMLFFAGSSILAVTISGRMLGRFKASLWVVPIWAFVSMTLYLALYHMIGGSFGGY